MTDLTKYPIRSGERLTFTTSDGVKVADAPALVLLRSGWTSALDILVRDRHGRPTASVPGPVDIRPAWDDTVTIHESDLGALGLTRDDVLVGTGSAVREGWTDITGTGWWFELTREATYDLGEFAPAPDPVEYVEAPLDLPYGLHELGLEGWADGDLHDYAFEVGGPALHEEAWLFRLDDVEDAIGPFTPAPDPVEYVEVPNYTRTDDELGQRGVLGGRLAARSGGGWHLIAAGGFLIPLADVEAQIGPFTPAPDHVPDWDADESVRGVWDADNDLWVRVPGGWVLAPSRPSVLHPRTRRPSPARALEAEFGPCTPAFLVRA